MGATSNGRGGLEVQRQGGSSSSKRKCRGTDDVWEQFPLLDDGGRERRRCEACHAKGAKTFYSATVTTGHLRAHLQKVHPDLTITEPGTRQQRTIECMSTTKEQEKQKAIPATAESAARINESWVVGT
eukprot:GHVU01058892.1.p2 GENE.GHVU01058892.1~~GHVU01058892.1.p2  ORF type:complete len:128 (-),score=14.50 GHVU01058892.1:106-489(-)